MESCERLCLKESSKLNTYVILYPGHGTMVPYKFLSHLGFIDVKLICTFSALKSPCATSSVEVKNSGKTSSQKRELIARFYYCLTYPGKHTHFGRTLLQVDLLILVLSCLKKWVFNWIFCDFRDTIVRKLCFQPVEDSITGDA